MEVFELLIANRTIAILTPFKQIAVQPVARNITIRKREQN
jgi:hypothetical protein